FAGGALCTAPPASAGPPGGRRGGGAGYGEEIPPADREIGRLLDALGSARAETLIVAAGDHGEAFGEHGEFSHSIFIYDTTLRVPLAMRGPGVGPSLERRTTNLEPRTTNREPRTERRDFRSGDPRRRCADRDAAAWIHDAGRRRDRSLAGAGRCGTAAARALRRIVRPAHGVWLGAAPRDPVGIVEVHRGAETRALRHRPRRLRADQHRELAADRG